MLFGAGVVLMTGRIEANGKPSAKLHYRRMGWLMTFGALHAYLLWPGDILVHYGICGTVVYVCRKFPLRPKPSLRLGTSPRACILLPHTVIMVEATGADPRQRLISIKRCNPAR
jgi:uncharacterized membrane protein YeiB